MNIKHIISWILQIIVVAILAPAVYYKFTAHPDTIEVFTGLGMEPGGRLLIGTLELATIIMLIIPHSIGWGALLGWGVMSGAIIAHATKLGFSGPAFSLGMSAILVWACCLFILFIRREEIEFIRAMFPKGTENKNRHIEDQMP